MRAFPSLKHHANTFQVSSTNARSNLVMPGPLSSSEQSESAMEFSKFETLVMIDGGEQSYPTRSTLLDHLEMKSKRIVEARRGS